VWRQRIQSKSRGIARPAREERTGAETESKLKDQDPSVRAAAPPRWGRLTEGGNPALTSALHGTEAGVVFSASSLLQLGDATAYRVYAVLTGERKTGSRSSVAAQDAETPRPSLASA
jgi:hypothetical protein